MIETVGNLRIIRELGHGGMGVVYLAEHIHLNKKFAVKSLNVKYTDDSNFRQRFFQEANNQAQIVHPNIVQATDFHEEQGRYFLVMEYVDGEDLDKLIQRKGRLSEKETLAIIKGILEGLGFAHRKGMIHRDIKPSNIMVSKIGNNLHVNIMDFGLAVLAGGERLTAADSGVIGTPWYQSPEQIKDPKKIDHRSDLYSLGIVLYEMLTGDIPFDGEVHSVIHQQINDPAPDISSKCPKISKGLAQIVSKCLEKHPDHRYFGCDELLKHLEELTYPLPEPQPPWVRILLGAAAVLLSCFVIFLALKNDPLQPELTSLPAQPEMASVSTPAPKQPDSLPVPDHGPIVAGIIENSMTQAEVICTLKKKLPRVRSNLNLARQITGIDPGTIDRLVNQEKKIKAEIINRAKKFNEITNQLQQYSKQIVTEKLNKYVQNEPNEMNKTLAGNLVRYYMEDLTQNDVAGHVTQFCSN